MAMTITTLLMWSQVIRMKDDDIDRLVVKLPARSIMRILNPNAQAKEAHRRLLHQVPAQLQLQLPAPVAGDLQLAVLAGWGVIAYAAAIRVFRWE